MIIIISILILFTDLAAFYAGYKLGRIKKEENKTCFECGKTFKSLLFNLVCDSCYVTLHKRYNENHNKK
jgi:protein-arginine kinase activator protein McsA